MATATKTGKPQKHGVWVNGKLVFSNADPVITEGRAKLEMRTFGNNVWHAKVGSFVAA